MIGKVALRVIERDHWKSDLRTTPRPLTPMAVIHRRLLKDRLKVNGGFSNWWATANQQRAWAIDEMEQAGEIVVTPGQHPWSAVVARPE